jgi:glycerol-3-phosphate acyltransferase PlsY
VPMAYLVARWSRGADIRQHGSGNVGVSNLMSLTSKRIAIAVIIFDLIKTMAMLWVAKLIGLVTYQQAAVALAAIIGQNWPVFLRFNGGRGMIATLGIAFFLPLINGFIPWEIVAFFAIALVFLLTIHNIPLGTGLGVASMPLVSWIANEPWEMTLGFLAIFLILIIRRLTAPKTSLTASVPLHQLLVNRFLFDRDIRDRKTWLNRQTIK